MTLLTAFLSAALGFPLPPPPTIVLSILRSVATHCDLLATDCCSVRRHIVLAASTAQDKEEWQAPPSEALRLLNSASRSSYFLSFLTLEKNQIAQQHKPK